MFFPISRIKWAGEVVFHGPDTLSGTHKCLILLHQEGVTQSQASYRKEGGQVVGNKSNPLYLNRFGIFKTKKQKKESNSSRMAKKWI